MQKIASEVAIGADPEMFLYDNEAEAVVPCVGILNGTKDEPYTPAGWRKGFAIQEDNVMVEFNIPPSPTCGEFVKNIRSGKIMVQSELDEKYGGKYSLYTGGHAHRFTSAQLASRQAQAIGCEADYNAYEGGAMRKVNGAPGLYRACGGHIHLGGDFKCPDFVAALFAELFIAVRGTFFADSDDPRVKWYGQPGIFRPKPYGIEYRTPSSEWLWNRDKQEYLADYALRCCHYLTNNDSVTLQKHFRAVPWLKVREYLLNGRDNARETHNRELWNEVMTKAQAVGVPL